MFFRFATLWRFPVSEEPGNLRLLKMNNELPQKIFDGLGQPLSVRVGHSFAKN